MNKSPRVVQQCSSTAVQQYSSAAVQQYSSAAVQQYSSTAVQQYSSTAVISCVLRRIITIITCSCVCGVGYVREPCRTV